MLNYCNTNELKDLIITKKGEEGEFERVEASSNELDLGELGLFSESRVFGEFAS